jgi:hypothetical protein
MLERQGMACAICGSPLIFLWAEFDHQAGRGMNGAHRDDRILIGGEWHNSALCRPCNSVKGSRRYSWQDGQYLPVVKP